MPAGTYIATPATAAGNDTYLTNGLGRLDDLSPEKSIAPPSRGNDLVSRIQGAGRGGKGISLATPRAGGRDPLRLLPNGPVGGKSEFTPLMKSVTKSNLRRASAGRRLAGVETPAYLREGYRSNGATPALPRLGDNSQIYVENTSSSAGGDGVDYTPLPRQVGDSSAQSTPLAALPGRSGEGAVVGDGNMMTLREQENIIDKIEKENFGLKMKIHFLEDALSKRGNEFNQAALKENTDLKVNRITMQRELHKFKKYIAQAEKDAELYRLQLEEYRERMKRKQADESVRVEVERMQNEIKTKETEVKILREKLDSAEAKERAEVAKLQDDVADLEADLRDKDRLVEEKEDEIDALKEDSSKESRAAADLEEELDNARRQIEELQEDLERAATEAREAKQEQQEAVGKKREAEENLDELREEMMNKSFTTKGLSRQLEEKTAKLENDLQEMQERHEQLHRELEGKICDEKELRERLRTLEREGAADQKTLQKGLEAARQQLDTANRKITTMSNDLRSAEKDLRIKTDEKDLLESRHDTLTAESAGLQQDLSKAQRVIRELEEAIDVERQRAVQNDHILRSQHKTEADHLTEQIDSLHREVNAKESQHVADQEEWESERRTLQSAKEKADEKAKGLQRTVDKLQEAEGTLSGRESKLQQALESEKQRHAEEEKVLSRQIEELNHNLALKRDASDGNRSELNNAKEELRISIREQASLKERITELEDEIEVLEANVEEEAEFAAQERKRVSEDADAQLQKIQVERQSLQDQIATVNVELHSAKRGLKNAEGEKDELEARLRKHDKSAEDTFNLDLEKRELRRTKQKLEKDLERMKAERDSLSQANQALEQEINAEIERANAEEHRLQVEIDLLKNKQVTSSETRDRELTSAKNRVQRLETRVRDLEDLLDKQPAVAASPGADVSGLRFDLSEARKNESAAKQRETELRSKTRDLQVQIANLQRELHESELARFKSKSPSASPPPSHSKELAQLRKDLVEARTQLAETKSNHHALERASRKRSVDETERADLHALLKSSSLEAEALALKLSERDAQISEMNDQLKRLRQERNSAARRVEDVTREIDTQFHDMKAQLQRLRDERGIAVKKADAVSKELDTLQARYEGMVDMMHAKKGRSKNKDNGDLAHEMRGLMKEIVYLKARFTREAEFREGMAWVKTVKPAASDVQEHTSNDLNTRLLRDLGITVPLRGRSRPVNYVEPKQKLRAGVFAVMAAIRMQTMAQRWRGVRALGEELSRQKNQDRGRVLGKWVHAALMN